MRFSAVVFDLFGTLVSGRAWLDYANVVAEMAESVGAPPTEFTKYFDVVTREDREKGQFLTIAKNVEYVCDQLGVLTTSTSIERASQVRHEFTRRALEPRSDTIDTLARLKEHGYQLGLISDCSPDVPLLWPETEMAQWIDVPIFSSEVGVKKPDREIYNVFAERSGLSPSKCLYIGDGGSSELTGARRVGMTAVLLRAPGEEVGTLVRPDAENWQGKAIQQLPQVFDLL